MPSPPNKMTVRAPDGTGKNRSSLTGGPLAPAIVRLAGPMLVSAVLQNAQSLIDLFWVGRLGSDAVAALALSGTVLMILFPLLMGIATGTVALVSRATGAGDLRQASLQAGRSIGLALLSGIILGLICLPLIGIACELLGASPPVAAQAVRYLRIMLLGIFSACVLFVANSAMQGSGNTVTPMLIMALANLLNMALDPLFIFGLGPLPGSGVAGAAAATITSQLTASLLGITILMRGKTRLKVLWRDLVPNRRDSVKLLRIGMPSMAQMLSRSLMGLVIFRIIAGQGTATVAGYGIGMRLHIVLLMPCFVLGNSAATMVGQNLGANRPQRARRAAWTTVAINSALMAVSATLAVWLAELVVGLFDQNPEVVRVGASYLRTVTPFYIFAGLAIVLDRALNGAGCTMSTMIFTVLTLWGMQVPLALGLSRVTSPAYVGVWWAICIATLSHAVLSTAWFETGRWQKKKI